MNVSMRSSRRLAGAVALCGGCVAICVGAASASASAGTEKGVPIPVPWGALASPFGSPIPPSNCPFDAGAVFVVTGNSVQHGSSNNNGEWGGETLEGSAKLFDNSDTASYTGHATAWDGNGTNARGQGEIGLTFDFHGVSTSDPSVTLSLHVDWHGTKNANGTITALTSHVSCS